GRPPKVAAEASTVVAATPKRRGRPPKAATIENANAATDDLPKRRGRPPKTADVATTTDVAEVPMPKRRGRPPKVSTVVVAGSTEPNAPKRRGRPPKTAAAGGDAVPTRRTVVKQGASAEAPAKRRGRPRKVVPEMVPSGEVGPVPARRIVIKQGVSIAQYRNALVEAEAASAAGQAKKATAKPDSRLAVSAEPGYAAPKRRIVVREGAMADYLAALVAPEPETLDGGNNAPVAGEPVVDLTEEMANPALLRRKRVEGEPRASLLSELAHRIDGQASGVRVPDVIPELVYDGEPPPPRKRPGRKPAVVVKKRRAKAPRAKGGLRRGRKPRKAGVLSAGARRRTVAPE
ncbi:MAG: hypothetical protein KDA41_16850, partial [Planctomycetales bacterium]|nr:hypothetical protein [Planctomycetales bacterium]